jgi:hypothetical protein
LAFAFNAFLDKFKKTEYKNNKPSKVERNEIKDNRSKDTVVI